ncbi:glycosyltransferase family 2 protein [Hydrogenophaga pseudoflava]|uniref:glycosyltransferase family 2 protein n=1 Tax=Hydrogenophaga pseudoflava TaxID=47421 RepID=UPI0027E46374|nr:glycosyltransferase [Hydrogenophaga pseudoflava]MDQ7747035.1 hypothetical protein [Hydrogenophaga pseudoflava]
MNAYVIVATKGRAAIAKEILGSLRTQSHPVAHILFVGSEPADVAGLDSHPAYSPATVSVLLSEAGLTKQRNAGLERLAALTRDQDPRHWFVVFFDDDFRLATDWVAHCRAAFLDDPQLVGVGGTVLADGITGEPITEAQARDFIEARRPPMKHTWSGARRDVPDLYGCNMAYRGTVAGTDRFDPALPFYGWLEDVDYSVKASRQGPLRYVPECRGVHMGASSGRTSGVRFGYSQIANPLYLIRKRTLPVQKGGWTLVRNMLSNGMNTLLGNRSRDYTGRLRGNLMALRDLVRGHCHPTRVTGIQ